VDRGDNVSWRGCIKDYLLFLFVLGGCGVRFCGVGVCVCVYPERPCLHEGHCEKEAAVRPFVQEATVKDLYLGDTSILAVLCLKHKATQRQCENIYIYIYILYILCIPAPKP